MSTVGELGGVSRIFIMIRLRALNEESSEESEGEEEIPLITKEAQVRLSLMIAVRLHVVGC